METAAVLFGAVAVGALVGWAVGTAGKTCTKSSIGGSMVGCGICVDFDAPNSPLILPKSMAVL